MENKERKNSFYTLIDVEWLHKRFHQGLDISSSHMEAKRRKFEVKKMMKREERIRMLPQSMDLAEMNRKSYLEKRRDSSRMLVERAKRVALENQHNHRQKQEKLRMELELRLEKSEVRRLAYLSRYKKSKAKVENVVENKNKPSAWSILLKAYGELNLPSPSNPDTWVEFNVLSQLLHEAKVIVVTTKILNAALKLIDEKSRYRGRVLLTAYMMFMCPNEILQNINDPEEKRLHESAKQMLQLYEIWIKAHKHPGATAARLAFVDAWTDYHVLFEKWKSRDRKHLIQSLIGYYIEIASFDSTIQQSAGLEQQLEEIKAKLEKLGGSSALQELEQALNKPEQTDQSNESNSHNNQSEIDPEYLSQLLNGYSQPGLSNQQLAHELILNPDFQLEKYEPQNELENRVKNIAEQAYFDKIMQDIETNNPGLLVLVSDIKARMLSLLRPGTSMFQHIEESIDISLIEQELKQNSFDMQKMMNYVLDTAHRMCAPIRDEEIQEARELSGIAQVKKLLDILEKMGLDLANFRLRSIRPHLMSMCVEYEREKFQESLSQDQALVRTEAWLNKSVDKLCQVAAQRNPECISPEKNNRPSHDSVFEDAFISLLSQHELLMNASDLPETLILDIGRMADFQNEVQAITIVAALVMLARNFGSADPSTLSDLALKLFSMLQDNSTTIDHLSLEIIRTVKVNDERKEMIRNMIDKTVSLNDTIYSLLLRRVTAVIKSTIHHNQFVSDAVISSNGLQYVQHQLELLSLRIQRLTHHHKKVYSIWYDKIITTALDKKKHHNHNVN